MDTNNVMQQNNIL